MTPKKKQLIVIISAVVLACSIIIPLGIQYNYKVEEAEAVTWERGKYAFICKLPTYTHPTFPKKYHPQVKRAVLHNNSEVPKYGSKTWFTYGGMYDGKIDDPVYAVILPPTPDMMKKPERGKHVLYGMCYSELTVSGDRGVTLTVRKGNQLRYNIHICYNKVEAAATIKTFRNKGHRKSVSTVVDFNTKEGPSTGVMGSIAHELFHPYMGGKIMKRPYSLSGEAWINAHVMTHKGLMAESPTTLSVGNVTKGIFNLHIRERCRKEGK